jgi:signal transduction histidine kinase
LLSCVVQTGLDETGARRANLLLRRAEDRFEVAASAGGALEYNVRWQELAEWVLRTRQPLVVDSQTSALSGDTPGDQGSILALPLLNKDRAVGVLVLDKVAEAEPFTDGDAELLNVLAGQAAIAIENARLFEERERAFRELEKMDHMKSEFINIAAHELRTPLSLVLGYAGLLEEDAEGLAKSYAQSITQNALRLRSIVEDMTNLRYLELNQSTLELAPVDLRHIVRLALDVVDRGVLWDVRVETNFPESVTPVPVDAQKLDLVLSNLLTNAYKFSPQGGKVLVSIQEREADLVVSVKDEGPGIPASEHANIWKRFYQIEHSLTRAHGGIGLGLAIVKGMVELHGGRVWVESAEGQGSAFYFSIPKRREFNDERAR